MDMLTNTSTTYLVSLFESAGVLAEAGAKWELEPPGICLTRLENAVIPNDCAPQRHISNDCACK